MTVKHHETDISYSGWQIHSELKKGFYSGKSKPISYRKYQLLQLAYLIKDNTEKFEEALRSDLGRPALESRLCVVTFARCLRVGLFSCTDTYL